MILIILTYMTKESEITEILLLLKQNLSPQSLVKKFSAENISTALWIMNNEEVVEIEEDFEMLNKK